MAQLDSQQKVELVLRAARLAKTALELMGLSSPAVARLQLVEIAKELRELDAFLPKA